MISIKLKETAKQKGYNLTDIANATHISMNTLSVLGRGDSKGIQFDTLNKICEFLSCTPNDILNFENDALDISMDKQPERINGTLLFSGELIPMSIIEDMQEGRNTGFRGHPFFIQLPEKPQGQNIVVWSGITELSVPHFEDRDTSGTSVYSLDESIDYLKSLSDNERDQLMVSAATFTRDRLAPEAFKGVTKIYTAWINDPNHNGAFPMLTISN